MTITSLNRLGRRLDPSALRRRYKLATEAAALRPVKLQDLRHAAGSIFARAADPAFVRDYLGHARVDAPIADQGRAGGGEIRRCLGGWAPRAGDRFAPALISLALDEFDAADVDGVAAATPAPTAAKASVSRESDPG
jgi:hypothetical protein